MDMRLRNEPKNLRICDLRTNKINLQAHLCVIVSPCLETCWFGNALVVKSPIFLGERVLLPLPLKKGGGEGESCCRELKQDYTSPLRRRRRKVWTRGGRVLTSIVPIVYCLHSSCPLPPWQYHNGCCVRGTMSALSWGAIFLFFPADRPDTVSSTRQNFSARMIKMCGSKNCANLNCQRPRKEHITLGLLCEITAELNN